MPIHDDPSIPDDAILLRVLHKDWVITEGDDIRAASFALIELGGEGECSCFLHSESIVVKLARKYPGLYVACIPALVLRENGFAIERRPADCPSDLEDEASCHVVIGPPAGTTKKEMGRRARKIVRDPRVAIGQIEGNP